ncbi:hypothetical protein GCM10020331_087800 [Ectobacillus funiculus]
MLKDTKIIKVEDDNMDYTMNLYVVRHGETYLNRYNKMQGWADSPLTEEGKSYCNRSRERIGECSV